MIRKKSWKWGEYGSFEYVLFLFIVESVLRLSSLSMWFAIPVSIFSSISAMEMR